MLHACVRTFDVTGTVENFLGTKHGLNMAGSLNQAISEIEFAQIHGDCVIWIFDSISQSTCMRVYADSIRTCERAGKDD